MRNTPTVNTAPGLGGPTGSCTGQAGRQACRPQDHRPGSDHATHASQERTGRRTHKSRQRSDSTEPEATQPGAPNTIVTPLARLLIFALLFAFVCLPAQAGPKKKLKVVDKKFVFEFLIPSAAGTFLAAEGASCLHYGPGGQIIRHPPCGRTRTYPIYFGLWIGTQVVPVYFLKKWDDEDRAAGRLAPKSSRWWAWGLPWPAAVGGMGVRNLARPACPSGTTCRQ